MGVLPPQAIGQWSTAQIHDTVAAIARQPAYSVPLRRSLLGRAFAYLIERFTDLLALLHGSRDFRVVVIVATALIVLAVVGRVVIARQLDIVGGRAGGSRNSIGERRDHWALSRELAASGDYTAACHALYAAVIDTLARNGDIKFHASKTAGDYAREMRRRGSPAIQNFRAFARHFDRVVYGSTSVDASEYARLAQAAEIISSVRSAA